jgi:hypothetical protein
MIPRKTRPYKVYYGHKARAFSDRSRANKAVVRLLERRAADRITLEIRGATGRVLSTVWEWDGERYQMSYLDA